MCYHHVKMCYHHVKVHACTCLRSITGYVPQINAYELKAQKIKQCLHVAFMLCNRFRSSVDSAYWAFQHSFLLMHA